MHLGKCPPDHPQQHPQQRCTPAMRSPGFRGCVRRRASCAHNSPGTREAHLSVHSQYIGSCPPDHPQQHPQQHPQRWCTPAVWSPDVRGRSGGARFKRSYSRRDAQGSFEVCTGVEGAAVGDLEGIFLCAHVKFSTTGNAHSGEPHACRGYCERTRHASGPSFERPVTARPSCTG